MSDAGQLPARKRRWLGASFWHLSVNFATQSSLSIEYVTSGHALKYFPEAPIRH